MSKRVAFGAVCGRVGCCELGHFDHAATLESTARSSSDVAASASERRYLLVCSGGPSISRHIFRRHLLSKPRGRLGRSRHRGRAWF